MGVLSERLRFFRMLSGETQESLAEKVPCSTSSIRQYEQGIKVPTALMLGRIAEVLQVTPNDLLSVNGKDEWD